jgi:DNA polymerase
MTYSADQITWFDFESVSAVDLKAGGIFRYVADASTSAIVLAYAIGDAPALTWHDNGRILDWDNAPGDLRAAFERSAIPFAAWNAGFDSAIWNYSTLGFPFLEAERVIDPMIQAGVSNLPTDLESASRALGGTGKQKDGKQLIKLFCVEGAAPSEHPAEWEQFLAYARQDVEAMRDVYCRTRPLPLGEWRQYWAFERINRRGVELDLLFAAAAGLTAVKETHGMAAARCFELNADMVVETQDHGEMTVAELERFMRARQARGDAPAALRCSGTFHDPTRVRTDSHLINWGRRGLGIYDTMTETTWHRRERTPIEDTMIANIMLRIAEVTR